MYKPLPQSVRLGRSNIHGYGLFTTVDLPKDTILGITHIYHNQFPDGWIRTPLGGFYNHSETPNCKLTTKTIKWNTTLDEGFLTETKLLQTIEYIKVGTELTCTYTLWKFEKSRNLKDDWLGL